MAQQMNHIASTIVESGSKAAYDAQAKTILSNKRILAWILKYSVVEFQNITVSDIEDCIIGNPDVGTVPVNPGMRPEAIIGLNTESRILNEGVIFYDIRFLAKVPGKDPVCIFINVEMQKKYEIGYSLVARGIFYCARMLSEQLNTEFVNPNYDDMKKVYSIWICADAPKYAQNTITEYRMTEHNIFGKFSGKSKHDLLSVVMVCLPKNADKAENELLRLLTVLFSEMSAAQKLEILENEFSVPITAKEVEKMCNLSDTIFEEGVRTGIEKGIEKGIKKGAWDALIPLVQDGTITSSIAAKQLGVDEDEVRKYVEAMKD